MGHTIDKNQRQPILYADTVIVYTQRAHNPIPVKANKWNGSERESGKKKNIFLYYSN